jgi:type IV secretory pathway VirB3-like protein
MQKSRFYVVLTQPNLALLVPRTYAALCVVMAGVGGLITALFFGVLAMFFAGFLIVGFIVWAIGAVKTTKDPEFFDVWLLHRFKIKTDVGDSTYEP